MRSLTAVALTALGAINVTTSTAGAATFDCVINPSMTLKIGSPVATTLVSVDVERGDHVTRGQVIARLELGVQAAEVALDEARASNTADLLSHGAKLDFAGSEDGRGEKLLETNSIARQKVDELRTNLRVSQQEMQLAVLDHRLAELNLARSHALVEQRVVRSPIDGIVVQRLLGPGEYVHQDAPIVQVAAIDPLYVEAFPPVRYFPFIKIGMKAEVKSAITGQPAHEVTVTIVDHVFDAASGTFGVRLALPNPNGDLSAGLRCQVLMPIDIIPDSVPTDAAVR